MPRERYGAAGSNESSEQLDPAAAGKWGELRLAISFVNQGIVQPPALGQ